MNYVRSYKSFINSQYLYHGVKVASGILIPALLMSYFDMLSTGIILSLGAMCVSITDGPGPLHHRRNAMIACLISIFAVTIIADFAAYSTILLGIAIFVLCFFFSMLNIYGARVGALGIASLLILVLNLQSHSKGWDIIWRALWLASGGLWYICYTILLHNFRPYKVVQQALGDCIQSIAEYLRLRAEFYSKDIEFENVYKRLLQQQATVQENQNIVNDLLFKTRDIVKESTATGRVLVMIYMDIADMFERIMTSYQFYRTLHDYFDEVDILQRFRDVALLLANELEEIGIAVKSGTPSQPNEIVKKRIKETKNRLDELRATFMRPANMEGFINLRRIVENIEDIFSRVQSLHEYTTYDRSLAKKSVRKIDYGKFISHQDITPEMLLDNLTLRSENFRHSLRVSIAVIVGFIGSLFFPMGHSYWILLTIVVILKPAYSLTKSRNIDRLLGTVIGLVIGIIIIYVIKDKTALLIIMILLMIGTYVFVRTHYFTAVILMTPYVVLFFHLLNPATFREVLVERLIDTTIGSAIAFAASNFLFPSWEREKIKPALIEMLHDSIDYFKSVTNPGSGKDVLNLQQLSRKDALVALANLSAAFNRMLSEPKRKQQGIADIHHFVVLCHMLVSHLATLSMFSQNKQRFAHPAELESLARALQDYLECSVAAIKGEQMTADVSAIKEKLKRINDETNTILEQRQEELKHGLTDTETRLKLVEIKSVTDQYNFIFHLASDIHKTARNLVHV